MRHNHIECYFVTYSAIHPLVFMDEERVFDGLHAGVHVGRWIGGTAALFSHLQRVVPRVRCRSGVRPEVCICATLFDGRVK